MKYKELCKTQALLNGQMSNRLITMEELEGGVFIVKEGKPQIRVGFNKPRIIDKGPIEAFDDYFNALLAKGFTCTKQERMEELKKVVKGEYKEIADEQLADFIRYLMLCANEHMEESYSIPITNISPEMITLAKSILQGLAKDIQDDNSVAAFNNKLMQLYQAIPRRIDKASDAKIIGKNQMLDKYTEEQEMFDFLMAEMASAGQEVDSNKTVLEASDISMWAYTKDEFDALVRRINNPSVRPIKAWHCHQKSTRETFDEYCKLNNYTEENGKIQYLFHGSRDENWMSIMRNGIYINPPEGVVITGKMFGYGAYFAIDAIKSAGYASARGSRWANGTKATGIMGIFKVAVGNPYYIYRQNNGNPRHYEDLKKYAPGCDSLWAERGNGSNGSGLRMDEIVVYQNQQITIDSIYEFELKY